MTKDKIEVSIGEVFDMMESLYTNIPLFLKLELLCTLKQELLPQLIEKYPIACSLLAESFEESKHKI